MAETVKASAAPLGVQLWPTLSPDQAPAFTLDSVTRKLDSGGREYVVWTYQNGQTRTFLPDEDVAVDMVPATVTKKYPNDYTIRLQRNMGDGCWETTRQYLTYSSGGTPANAATDIIATSAHLLHRTSEPWRVAVWIGHSVPASTAPHLVVHEAEVRAKWAEIGWDQQ